MQRQKKKTNKERCVVWQLSSVIASGAWKNLSGHNLGRRGGLHGCDRRGRDRDHNLVTSVVVAAAVDTTAATT